MHRGGSGTPLLLLHGFTVSWRAWKPVLLALEVVHEVIAPTLAGHHGAAALTEAQPPNVRSLADVIEAQLDDLGIEAPHIAGNSLGGWVGLELARRGRARSVVGLSPAAAARNVRDLRRLHRLVQLNQRLMVLAGPRTQNMLRRPRFRRVVMRFGFERADRFPAAEIPGLFEDIAACTIFEALTAAIEEEGMIERDGLAEIACPVRIAWGVEGSRHPVRPLRPPAARDDPPREIRAPTWLRPRLHVRRPRPCRANNPSGHAGGDAGEHDAATPADR
jgi:pimeloyl-ACP methyl ester carboxylesterase